MKCDVTMETLLSLLSSISEEALQRFVERFGAGTLLRVVTHILLSYIISSLIVAYTSPHFELPPLIWRILGIISPLPAIVLFIISIFYIPILLNLGSDNSTGQAIRGAVIQTIEKLKEEGRFNEERALEIIGEYYSDQVKRLWKYVVLLYSSYWISLISIMIFIDRFYLNFLSLDIAIYYIFPLLIAIIVATLTITRFKHILSEAALALTRGFLAKTRLPGGEKFIEFMSLFTPLMISTGDKVENTQILFLAVIPNKIKCHGLPEENNDQICKAIENTDKYRMQWFSERTFRNILKIDENNINLLFVSQEYINIFLENLKRNYNYQLIEIKCSNIINTYVNSESLLICLIRGLLESLVNGLFSVDGFFAISKVLLDVPFPIEFPAIKYKNRIPDILSYRLCFCKFFVDEKPISLYVIVSWGNAVKKISDVNIATNVELSKPRSDGNSPTEAHSN